MSDLSELGLALDATNAPIEAARGLPSTLYTSPSALDLECRRIFHGGWACVGTGADVPNPGDVAPLELVGAPLLLVRDRAGELRLFHNVCRHRGMILVEGKRNVPGVLRCPYHSWCYSLTGELRATPHVGGPGINDCASIDRAASGLIPVRMGVFLDAVFADLSAEAPPFETFIAPLRDRWRDFAGQRLHYGGPQSSFVIDLACNWKLAVENYCESYHLPWVHPGLNAYSKLEDHYNIMGDGFSGQGTRVYAPDLPRNPGDFPGLPASWQRAAEYIALYPNVLFGVHRDHVYSIRLEPLSHARTREHITIYYADPDAATGSAWTETRECNAVMWKGVFLEDVFVVEGMQRGRAAPGFDGGLFSPVMDAATHRFHAWIAQHLA